MTYEEFKQEVEKRLVLLDKIIHYRFVEINLPNFFGFYLHRRLSQTEDFSIRFFHSFNADGEDYRSPVHIEYFYKNQIKPLYDSGYAEEFLKRLDLILVNGI